MSYFKVSYGSFKLVIIQAGSHKEAAIKYFNLFPCNEDKWITVLKKGFRSRKNVMMYRSSELFADQIKIESGNKNFKESKLDSYLIKLYKLVKNSKPEWLNNIWNSEDDKCDLKSGLIISISKVSSASHFN